MAKNFEQYDDSPVMSYLSKAKEEVKQTSDANQILKSASSESDKQEENSAQNSDFQKNFQAESHSESVPHSETKYVQEKENIAEPKKILMNISIRETTKKDWKMFFLEHDLSMTQGIETAVEFLKSEVEKGNIRLSKGGITK